MLKKISFDKLGDLFSANNIKVIVILTFFAVLSSVLIVYIVRKIFNTEYTMMSFAVSAIIPTVLAPASFILIMRLSTHLHGYKKSLQQEIEKNKKKDLMLFEQARFVLMGEMMANISHQWKQPLNNVALAIVSTRFSESEELREKNFNIMEENINYLSNTINDFMSFFDKKTADELKTLDDIVHEIKSIMKAQVVSRGIKLSINIDDTLKSTKLTSVISQVLLNLLSNAKDAADESKEDKEIVLYFKSVKNGIVINCCDNGLGINKKDASKIFDPYFTTKDKKQGAGIGLYMSKQIITKIFDGTIVLDEVSKNTCFRIDIPCSKNCQIKEITFGENE